VAFSGFSYRSGNALAICSSWDFAITITPVISSISPYTLLGLACRFRFCFQSTAAGALFSRAKYGSEILVLLPTQAA
jgi:hypothetical protein